MITCSFLMRGIEINFMRELEKDLKELVSSVAHTSLMVKKDHFTQLDTSSVMRDMKKICLFN